MLKLADLSPRRLAGVAVAIGWTALACGLALRMWAVHQGYRPVALYPADILLCLAYPPVGLLLLRRSESNRCGWLLVVPALLGLLVFSDQWATFYGVGATRTLPLTPVAVWTATWTYLPYPAIWGLLPVLFPDGRPAGPRLRLLTRIVVGLLGAIWLSAAFGPNHNVERLGRPNPLGLGSNEGAFLAVQYGSTILSGLLGPVGIAGLVGRARRATGVERAQLQWLLLGLLGMSVLIAISLIPPQLEVPLFIGMALPPAAVAIAVLRHGLFDVELVVNRAVVYVALTAVGLLAYLGSVTLLGRGSSPVAAAVLALAAAGVRSRLQRLVDRWLFGHRSDPYQVVERVGQRLEAASPTEALAVLAAELAKALALPFVGVDPDDDRLDSVAVGRVRAGTERVPISAGGRRLGHLVVGLRYSGERLRPDERSALADVARRAAAVLAAGSLTADLQRSRERLVSAREEERRRLRRDLHDGLGPDLAALALQIEGLVTRLAVGDPELAGRATRIRDRLQATVAEVRRIVDDLRPAAVDQLGLAKALRELANIDIAGPTRVEVTTGADLDGVGAAAEVATYRICAEALANSLRHADARRCSITLELVDGRLELAVEDDGVGFGEAAEPGVGIASMRERATEVGGWATVETRPGVGTTVRASLPAGIGEEPG